MVNREGRGNIYPSQRGTLSTAEGVGWRCEHSALSTAKHDRWGTVSLRGNSQNMSDRYQPFRSWSRMCRWAEGEPSARGNPQNTTPVYPRVLFSDPYYFLPILMTALSRSHRRFVSLQMTVSCIAR